MQYKPEQVDARDLSRAFEAPRTRAGESEVVPPLPRVKDVLLAVQKEVLGLQVAKELF